MSDDECDPEVQQEAFSVSDGGTPLLDRILAALAHQRRRFILYYLRDHSQAQTDDLAVQIHAWEHDIAITDVTPTAADQVKLTLVQSHLPKLDDYGFIDYDQRSSAVCYTHPPPLLEEALELAVTIEHPP